MVQQKPRANYTSPSDILVLEDESGRVILAGGESDSGGDKGAPPFPLSALTATVVTGVVLAIRGWITASGELRCCDVGVAGLGSPLPPLPPPNPSPRFVLLLSGLAAGVPAGSAPLSLQLLAEWLSGAIGGREAVGVSGVVRCIIAGGLVGSGGCIGSLASAGGSISGSSSSSSSSGGSSSSSSGNRKSASNVFTDTRLSTAAEQEAVVSVRMNPRRAPRAARVFCVCVF